MADDFLDEVMRRTERRLEVRAVLSLCPKPGTCFVCGREEPNPQPDGYECPECGAVTIHNKQRGNTP